MTEAPSKMQQVLEIHLISAQGLKPPASPRRRLQTYSVAWVDPSTKLRTRVDQIGGENPTWNDRFLFRVTPEFVASETSAVSVAIYSVGLLRDHLIGTVRFLISNILRPGSDDDGDAIRTPSFCALQIRRPSGRFHGIMNIGAMLLEDSDFPALNGISAIGYRDLMGGKEHHHRGKRHNDRKMSKSKQGDEVSSKSCENSCADSVDLSDGADSTTSSSSSTSTALKDWNGVRELAGSKAVKSPGFLCGLLTQRRIHLCPSDPDMCTETETQDVECKDTVETTPNTV